MRFAVGLLDALALFHLPPCQRRLRYTFPESCV